jgi:hypothetical protein
VPELLFSTAGRTPLKAGQRPDIHDQVTVPLRAALDF